jgi:hypothetical protein
MALKTIAVRERTRVEATGLNCSAAVGELHARVALEDLGLAVRILVAESAQFRGVVHAPKCRLRSAAQITQIGRFARGNPESNNMRRGNLPRVENNIIAFR